MHNLMLVGLGGFLGSVARYSLSGLVLRAGAAGRFPLATLVVNLLGCFLMGLLSGLAERWHLFGTPTRLFLLTGLLGGFTTYSAFAYETWFLGREQLQGLALLNIALQVVGGLSLLWLGHQLATR